MTDILGIMADTVRERTHPYKRNEDWLTATFNVVRLLDDRQANLVWELLQGRPLTVHEADMYQFLAQRLGKEIAWQHRGLMEHDELKPGRGDYPLQQEGTGADGAQRSAATAHGAKQAAPATQRQAA